MPPQISNDEASEKDSIDIEEGTTMVVQTGREKPVIEEIQESLRLESGQNEDDEDEDDDEPGEDEYVVEAIKDHFVDEETGDILYNVKWEGYDKKSDRTWEPEANLQTAPKILEEYIAKVGGKDLILAQWAEKKASKGKKRGRTSTRNGTTSDAYVSATKRGRKNRNRRASATPPATPPAGVRETEFRPPSGSWEEDVVEIDACEGDAGTVVVFLTWKGGQKTQHPLNQVYKRCPQKMLKFYERHLIFKRTEDPSA